MIEKNFAGLDGFVWWMGVVESREDPKQLGRCKVRIYGFHTESLADIPTEDLPWAHPIHALNTRSFTTPKEADVVFGFFADGRSGQYPIMVGILPGIETSTRNTGQGFHDMRTDLSKFPKPLSGATYNTDGSGVSLSEGTAEGYPLTEDVGHSTISRAARYAQDHMSQTVVRKKENQVRSIFSADGQSWDEPFPAYNPTYPLNHTIESESGNLFEIDDTPGAERIAITHRTGTYTEMFPSGSKVEKITKSNYQIVMADDHLYVMGKAYITVGADCYVKVLGDAKIEVGNDLSLKVSGDMNLSVSEDLNIRANKINIQSDDDTQIISSTSSYFTSGKDTHIIAADAVNIDGGSPVSINNGDAESGSPASVGWAGSRSTPNSGDAFPEIPPTNPRTLAYDPYSLDIRNPEDKQKIIDNTIGLTAIEADSYGRSLAKDKVNGELVEPTTTPIAGPCTFNKNTATFLSSKESWSLGSVGLDHIKFYEGFSSTAYRDVNGLAIGYGTTGAAIDREIDPNETITKEQATEYLNQGVNNKYLPTLKKYVKVPLTQTQVDGLLSFIYNVGPGNFASSTLLKKLNQEDYCGAAEEMLRWNKSAGRELDGLTSRRTREREIFIS